MRILGVLKAISTLGTVVNYQFTGADEATTTTDSTGHTTASGLGLINGATYAKISGNTLLTLRSPVTIDNSGGLSSHLIFTGDFEIEISVRVDFWSFAGTQPFWTLLNGSGQTVLSLQASGDGHLYLQSLTNTALVNVTGTWSLTAGIDLVSQQSIKLTRVGTTLSAHVGGVLKGTTTSVGTFDAGRFRFDYDDIEHFTDYLVVKK